MRVWSPCYYIFGTSSFWAVVYNSVNSPLGKQNLPPGKNPWPSRKALLLAYQIIRDAQVAVPEYRPAHLLIL